MESEPTFLRFPGQYYDTETGLYYNVNRSYDPSIGRYIESDPMGLGGGINTYGYAMANPMSLADPLDLMIYRGPGNVYSDMPPSSGCQVAMTMGYNIIGWSPCDPASTPPVDGGRTNPPCPPKKKYGSVADLRNWLDKNVPADSPDSYGNYDLSYATSVSGGRSCVIADGLFGLKGSLNANFDSNYHLTISGSGSAGIIFGNPGCNKWDKPSLGVTKNDASGANLNFGFDVYGNGWGATVNARNGASAAGHMGTGDSVNAYLTVGYSGSTRIF